MAFRPCTQILVLIVLFSLGSLRFYGMASLSCEQKALLLFSQ